jgi:hypothetical protein
MDAHDLAKVAFHEVDIAVGHRFDGDLDMHSVAGPVRPHSVGCQIAFSERLQQAGQQAGRTIGVE